jgi:N-acetylmuramoyl-L-alanine amidase
MMNGIRKYFYRNPPPGTRLVRRHVIQRGDTLVKIAEQYNVSLNRLKSINDLKNDLLLIGNTLRIPPSSDS